MKASPVAIFAAGFVAGGLILGGVVAHARIITLNDSMVGVLPNSEGALFCVTAQSRFRNLTGETRGAFVGASGGGFSGGIILKCPA